MGETSKIARTPIKLADGHLTRRRLGATVIMGMCFLIALYQLWDAPLRSFADVEREQQTQNMMYVNSNITGIPDDNKIVAEPDAMQRLTTTMRPSIIYPVNMTAAQNHTTTCPARLMAVIDKIDPAASDESQSIVIPRRIHFVSKSRCFTKTYVDNLFLWRNISGHSFFVHEDSDVNEFFAQEDWESLFPGFHRAIRCLPNGGGSSPAKADLWRYLWLWQHGGLYSDVDNAPGRDFRGITDDNDGLLVFYKERQLDQSFLMFAPHHPLLFLAVQIAVQRLLAVEDLSTLSAWQVTGPAVLLQAFRQFTGLIDLSRPDPGLYHLSAELYDTFRGNTNRSVTVETINKSFVISSVIRGRAKKTFYRLSGMVLWKTSQENLRNESCAVFLDRTTR